MREIKPFFVILLGTLFCIFLSLEPAWAFHFPWDQGHDTFQPNPPGDKPQCPHEDNRCETSHPVDIGAGDKIQRSVDFILPGFGPQLALLRSYHSQDLANGPFGFGWHSNLTVRLILANDGQANTAIVVQGDGKRKRFVQQSNGSWASAAGTFQTLTVAADGSAQLRDKDGTVQFFDRSGRLIRIEDRNANALTIAYDAQGVIATATAASGRKLTFTKGADGRIASVADPLGHRFQYFYDSSGRMNRVLDAVDGETRYTYDANNNLQTVVDARGNTAVTLTYDDQDRVLSEVLADGATYQFSYLNATQTRVTNPRYFQTLYTFNSTGQPIQIQDPLGRTIASTWDANYNRLTRTDGNGHTTTYAYDANGNLIKETDALGQTTAYTFEPTFSQVTSETDADGYVTRFEHDTHGNVTKIIDAKSNQAVLSYDAQGRLTSATDPRGNTTRYSFDTAGNLIRVTDALGNAAQMAYDAAGNLTAITDAEGRTTRFEYDGLNRRIKAIDAAGGVTTITYDPNGNIATVTDPRGQTTIYGYDSRNRLISKTNALSQVEQRSYDGNDNLISLLDVAQTTTIYTYDDADQRIIETRPGGVQYRYEYDNAGNQIAVIDPAGVRIDRTLDAANRLTAVVHGNGDRETYGYDKRGNQTAIKRQDGTNQVLYTETRAYDALSQLTQYVAGMGQTTRLSYDASGNLSTVTDPLGRITSRAYDALDRVVQLTDAANGVTQYAYDRVNNVTALTDPKSLVTGYRYDALDRKDQVDSPDTGNANAVYDASGNLIRRTDSRGVTVTHAYDALNRRTATQFPNSSENRTYLYDQGTNGAGRLTGYDDESGSARFTYDERGNLLTETRAIQSRTYTLNFSYDGADRPTALTYPSGLDVAYSYDGQGRVLGITASGQPVASNIVYLPLGLATAWTDGSGLSHAKTFDADYRPTGITVGVIQGFGYLYDAANNITGWTDTLDGSRTQDFGYDTLDHLLKAKGSYGEIDFSYDPVGNRLSKAIGAALTSYAYPVDSHRLQKTTGARSDTFSYDAAGNLIQDNRFTYSYNQANRLAEVKQGGGTVARYIYNAEGQRVAKTVGGQSHHFVYGRNGQLLGVYDGATGAAIEEIVYLDTIPVATVREGVLYYIHTDHLGTPRLVSDQNQIIIWRWTSAPFGEAMPDENPDGDGVFFAFNLRFPGQYFDAETERHYNYFRDYDPALGRYVQSDPIGGLAGGLNTYAYVGGNPLSRIDPFGLAYFAKRPLSGFPWLGPFSSNPLDDLTNTEISHEQLFFEDGGSPSNIGFFNDGTTKEEPNPTGYRHSPGHFDDCIMRIAVKNVPLQPYSLLGKPGPIDKFNCQDWAERVRQEYRRLANDPAVQQQCMIYVIP